MELLLQKFSSQFVSLPTKRRFNFTVFFNSYFCGNTESIITGKSREDAIFFFMKQVLPLSKKSESELLLKCPAMPFFLFQTVVFCSLAVYNLVPDADRVAKKLKVSHSDCGTRTENTLYAVNQVRQCHITPDEQEFSLTIVILYTKHFRKELNATKS